MCTVLLQTCLGKVVRMCQIMSRHVSIMSGHVLRTCQIMSEQCAIGVHYFEPVFLCTTLGLSGWGIAFYIDGMLAPVLRLSRNVEYTFIVEAGNDPNDAPNYHPFYITSSQDGGILLNQGMQVGS